MPDHKSHAPRGGTQEKTEISKSPHAPKADKLGSVDRRSAVIGGVTDEEGNPTAREIAAASAALESNSQRDPIPMMITGEDGAVGGPYDNPDANHVRMLETFGTNSSSFMVQQINYLLALDRKDVPQEIRDMSLNASIAFVAAVAPENAVEAALAVQMASTHALACKLTGRACGSDDAQRAMEYVNAATKVQRTFASQLEALARLRGKGQQTVRVEHVTVQPGAQAIVGDVHHHSTQKEIDHAVSNRFGDGSALPSPDPVRQALPRARNAERPMPDARRTKQGRSEGKPKRVEARPLHDGGDS